jgi:hypothetical protein
MQRMLLDFRWAIVGAGAGLALAFWLGWSFSGTMQGALSFLLIGTVLATLEISLSFDNAIVNATVLQTMTPVWQERFLTWGILIAVVGMRIVFPLAIVAIAAGIGPLAALDLAISRPGDYARIIGGAHLSIAAFGGTFLMMVALTYFVDGAKDIHWIGALERPLRSCACVRGFDIGLVLTAVLLTSCALGGEERAAFLFAALSGLLTYLLVEVAGSLLDAPKQAVDAAVRGGLGAFLYLEVLDASFSFDGVIGAFALTQNLFLIGIGLGIGALFVRSMTIMLVRRKTLAQFRYLEHGAFYSILALSLIMFLETWRHVPEAVTGLLGAGLIALSIAASLRHNRAEERAAAQSEG